MDKLMAIGKSSGPQDSPSINTKVGSLSRSVKNVYNLKRPKQSDIQSTGWTPPSRHGPLAPTPPPTPPAFQTPFWSVPAIPPPIEDLVKLTQRNLTATRKELSTLRSEESALVSKLKQLGGVDTGEFATPYGLLPEEVIKTVALRQSQVESK